MTGTDIAPSLAAGAGRRRPDQPTAASEYSPALARVGAFAVKHKVVVFRRNPRSP